MIEVRSDELSGPALHWAVAQVLGLHVGIEPPHYMTGWRVYDVATGCAFRPSTDWGQGGPLVDRYIQQLCEGVEPGAGWENGTPLHFATANDQQGHQRFAMGETKLIAAMRAIALATFGRMVMIPAVLATPEAATDAA